MPAVVDPERRPPLVAVTAAVLALPTAFLLLALGNAALAIAGGQQDGGGATWFVLALTIGWLAGLLVGAVRLLLGRAWIGLTVSAGLFAVLLTAGIVIGGFDGAGLGATLVGWVLAVATAVLASLPGVRHWVARRRRERLFPGSVQRSASRP